MTTLTRGYDVSAYQPRTVPKAGFVFVKVTEGGGKNAYVSSAFAAQWASAGRNADHRGGYHFARPEESSPGDQAKRMLDLLQPVTGESVWLDLEASRLSQSQTNAWARGWGDIIRDEATGITSGVYLGGGYMVNGTGQGLADHFDGLWYPQYPGAFSLGDTLAHDQRRALNRSSLVPGRTPLVAGTTSWPTAFTPWIPAGQRTGFDQPTIWQFTDNESGYDASVSWLTPQQLGALGGGRTPTEEIDMAQRDLRDGLNKRSGLVLPPKKDGSGYSYVEFNADNSLEDGPVKAFAPVTLRVAIQRSNHTWQRVEPFVVGRGPKDTEQGQYRIKLDDKNSIFVSVTRKSGVGDEEITVCAY